MATTRKAHWLFSVLGALLLVGCSTPYRPPVFVAGGHDFPGIAGLVREAGGRPLDVVLVHGMCTNDRARAESTIDLMVQEIGAAATGSTDPSILKRQPAQTSGIELVERQVSMLGGTVSFSAIVWSPLTRTLKQQLSDDATSTPVDCAADGVCKPARAKLNGALKDGLLNDCLSDALIYQGVSRDAMRAQMVAALKGVLERSETRARGAGTAPGPLVLVTQSLGSKLTFDALDEMLNSGSTPTGSDDIASKALGRLALVYMAANQLPILHLAEQRIAVEFRGNAAAATRAPMDTLQSVLQRKSRWSASPDAVKTASIDRLSLVAFTDPNDLLSYRLQRSLYDIGGPVEISDVLVSNAPTLVGLLERPDVAHTGYLTNPDVTALIACGKPRSAACRQR